MDVLLWAGTHRFEAYELEGKFFVNPGSATGAFSTSWGAGPGGGGGGGGEDVVPSFCLMDVSFSCPLRKLAWDWACRAYLPACLPACLTMARPRADKMFASQRLGPRRRASALCISTTNR